MSQLLKEFEGTWEEVLAHSDEFAGHHVYIKIMEPITLPVEAGLSIEQTAEMMRVSPAYVQKLISSRELISYYVGEECRVRPADLATYQERYKREARAALDEMAAEAQRLGLYE